MLSRLIYISENQIDSSRVSLVNQLSNILSSSNRNNRASRLTGALIFDQMWFLQALEGERRSVWSEFQRIADDDRHSNVMLVEMVDIEHRMFGNWWMGFATRTPETEYLFAPYTRKNHFHAEEMKASEVLGMMRSFADLGKNREVVSRVVAHLEQIPPE